MLFQLLRNITYLLHQLNRYITSVHPGTIRHYFSVRAWLLPVTSLNELLPLLAKPLAIFGNELLLFMLLVLDDSVEIDDPPLKKLLLPLWFFAFGVGGASGGPNRRLYESLPGLLDRGDRMACVLSLALPKNAEPSWDWLWVLTRRGLVSSAPKMSLLPPPGGFNTLEQ